MPASKWVRKPSILSQIYRVITDPKMPSGLKVHNLRDLFRREAWGREQRKKVAAEIVAKEAEYAKRPGAADRYGLIDSVDSKGGPRNKGG